MKQTNHTPTALDNATDILRRGWQPIPIPHLSKNPNFAGWQNLNLTENDLAKHFNGKLQNIGVHLGTKSNGLTDIDLDSPEAIKIADYFLPPTEAVFGRTSKPRSHRLYYCANGKFEKFNNPFLVNSKDETQRKQACIVELRTGDGLQTVFPGSTHESGEAINWQSDGEPLQIDSQTLRRACALLASACLISTFWRNGMRNELNLALSGALLRNGFDLAATKQFIRAVGAAANDEEISDRLKAIDATAQKLESGENVYGFPKLAEITDRKLVETICKWLLIGNKQESEAQRNNQNETPGEFIGNPKPLDLILKPVEPIDEKCLPKVLVNWLRPASKIIGCPFDFLVFSAIVTAGSLIGSRVRVKALQNSDWFVVPNVYGGIVGLPSSKKTPALDETRKPILELQAKARKEFADKRKDFEIEARYYERETAAIYKNKDLNLEQTKQRIKDIEEPNHPTMKRFETNDITTPKLAQFLAENPNGLLQFRDELTGWLKSLDADYDTNARTLILELWKGAINYEKARVGDGEIQIQSGTLSIIGGIQPSKLQKYVAEAYSFDNSDGFLQRFLFVYPDPQRHLERSTASDFQAMQDGYAAADKVFAKLAENDFNGRVNAANGDRFYAVKFAPDAQKVINEWTEEIETEAEKLQIEDEAFSSFLCKLPKSCFAVALIFHCLENINQAAFPDEITAATALNAISYIKVLISHAGRVFALGENQIFALANMLLGKIRKGNLKQGFKGREVIRKQWSGLKSKDTVQDVLSLLIDYGYLREHQTSGEGRRTVDYYFHPSLEIESKSNSEETSKTVSAKIEEIEKTEISLEQALSKTDKTEPDLSVLSVFDSGQLPPFPENLRKIESEMECSICGLELEIWQNELFCSMGCRNPTKIK